MINKDLGTVTAYAYAKAGGYTGTEAQFTELLGSIAEDLAEIENLSVTVETLPAGSQATASYADGVLHLGIPKGDKGDKGDKGEIGLTPDFSIGTVETLEPGESATATITGTDEEPVLNLGIPKGDKGDTGDVSSTGTYPDLTAGNAEQLVGTTFEEDQTPYNFRTSGGSMDIGDREYLDAVVGGTVAWNQLCSPKGGVTTSGVTFSLSADGVITLSGTATASVIGLLTTGLCHVNDHKYLFRLETIANPNGLTFTVGVSSGYPWISNAGTVGAHNVIYTSAYSTALALYNVEGLNFDGVKLRFVLHDLTAMFGTTIADHIYSLETATAGAGVAWFKKLFPKRYYEYNAGELVSVKAVSHNLVGFNQWDEEVALGELNSDGSISASSNRLVSKNFIPVIEGQTYYMTRFSASSKGRGAFYDSSYNLIQYLSDFPTGNMNKWEFTVPSGASFLKFCLPGTYGTTYKNDICINLSWDGERNGEYEPYVKRTYALDDSLTLRGIPKLDASNNMYFDGDQYGHDGTVTRRYAVVDLGTLNWSLLSANRFWVMPSGMKPFTHNLISSQYYVEKNIGVGSLNDREMTTQAGSGELYVKDTRYEDAAAFKTAMSGVYLVYELATSTTEEADSYQHTQIVDDFGTEEFVDAGSRDVAIPVGHITRYAPNLRAKLEMSPNSPDGDGDYIVRQTNGENVYVSFASNATIQDIIARIEALEGGGE